MQKHRPLRGGKRGQAGFLSCKIFGRLECCSIELFQYSRSQKYPRQD